MNGQNNTFSATSSVGQNDARMQQDLNALLDEVRDAGLSLPADLLQNGGRKRRVAKPKSKSKSKGKGKKMSGGAKKSRKHSKKMSEAKKVKKVSRKSSKKHSKKMTGGKKVKVAPVAKKSKKSKKSRSQSRELPAGMIAHQEFVRYLQSEMNLKGGVIVNMLAKVYKDIAKKNNPDSDSVELAKKAKEVFAKEKSTGQPQKRLKELEASRASKKTKAE